MRSKLARIAPPERVALAAALAGLAGLLLTCFLPLIMGKVLIQDDLSCFHLPLRYFYAQCLAQGEDFHYLPHLFMGLDLHGEGQAGMYHPFHYLLYRTLPLPAAFSLELLLSYPFMAAGMFLLLRRWQFPAAVCAAGAMLLPFGGFPVSCYHYIHVIEVLAHTPWLLLCIHIAMETSSRRTAVVAIMGVWALTTSQWYLGYPPMVMISGLLEGAYALLLAWRSRRWPCLAALLGAKILSAVAGAAQLWPTLCAARESIRSTDTFSHVVAIHPANVLHLLSPYLFARRVWEGPESGYLYAGAAATLLVVWLFARPAHARGERAFRRFFLFTGLVGLLLAFGEKGLLYTWVFGHPLLEKLSAPARFLAVFHISFVMLACAGLADLVRSREKAPWRPVAMLGIVPGICILTTLLVMVARRTGTPGWLAEAEGQLAGATVLWASAAIVSLAALLLAAAARGWRVALAALLLFTAFDLWAFGLRNRPIETFESFRAGVDVPPQATEGYRIDPDYRPVWAYNGMVLRDRRASYGYAAIPPRRALDYYLKETPLRLAGVRYMRSRLGATEALNKAALAGQAWVPVPDPMPRARLVADARVSENPMADLDGIDIAQTVLLEAPVALDPGPPGEARVVEESPGRMVVSARAPTRRVLVLSEAYSAGWHITVDDAPTESLRAYGDFLACVIPSGEHTVRLRFSAAGTRQGRKLAAIGFLLSALYPLVLAPLLRRGPNKANP